MTTAGEIVKLAPLSIRLLPRWLRRRFTAKFDPIMEIEGWLIDHDPSDAVYAQRAWRGAETEDARCL